jgi:hypothetical protein
LFFHFFFVFAGFVPLLVIKLVLLLRWYKGHIVMVAARCLVVMVGE